jgi:uncharacterized protein YqeY
VSIQAELADELKAAMRAHDRNRTDVVRQIMTEVARAMKAPGFKGEADDDLYPKTIAIYAKKMGKALAEYDRLGHGQAEAAAKLKFEVDYLGRWLLKALTEEELAGLIAAAVEELGVTDMQAMGQVMGYIKKAHPEIDGAVASRLVKARLGGG